jgi:propionyl-CoA carboxylase alpha chain
MRTAKRMGIKTVAVFSEPDRHSLHVELADEAVHIGPALSSESYLRIDRIIEACKATGADAVHPGYGFLSENSHFVEQCEKNGITFIGPPTAAMEALGDKINSKKIAKKAGVTIVPGFVGEVHDDKEVLKIANEIGYPVMVKASAGGGGKGMRVAWNDQEALEGYRLSRQEAKSAFGDDRILIEKFIDNPRHIEFQILADGQGGAVYLPERECSIQRRNQKVVEEAPSPFLTPEVRHAMGSEAVALALAVNYKNTGTVEFLIDPQSNYYFLEMNTRLQVEHPITEEITGIDIVEHMIKIAAGQKLSLKQADVGIHGWAMESRLYAEDPLRNFLPSIGKLTRYVTPEAPEGANWLRIDSGIREGSEISIYYDPLISKLVTYAPTRQEAIGYMRHALDSYVIRGLNHNMCFLRDVMDNQVFIDGHISTSFIPQQYPKGFHGHLLTPTERAQLLSTAAAIHFTRLTHQSRISGRLESFEPAPWTTYSISIIDDISPSPHDPELFDLLWTEDGLHVVSRSSGDANDIDLSNWPIDSTLVQAALRNSSSVLGESSEMTDDDLFTPLTMQLISINPHGYTLQFVGTQYNVEIMTPRERELSHIVPKPKKLDLTKNLVSPMAGQLISVAVEPGQKVAIGQELAIVEAMKMQNVLRAQRDGVVKAVKSTAGSSIALDQIIIEFE